MFNLSGFLKQFTCSLLHYIKELFFKLFPFSLFELGRQTYCGHFPDSKFIFENIFLILFSLKPLSGVP
jgi:hypothetical protein